MKPLKEIKTELKEYLAIEENLEFVISISTNLFFLMICLIILFLI